MVGLGNLAVSDCLHIDGHDPEALAGVRGAEEHTDGVPVTSPLTITLSPETSTSCIWNLRSGIDVAKPPTILMEASRPQHSLGR